jgi:hypothetical protein
MRHRPCRRPPLSFQLLLLLLQQQPPHLLLLLLLLLLYSLCQVSAQGLDSVLVPLVEPAQRLVVQMSPRVLVEQAFVVGAQLLVRVAAAPSLVKCSVKSSRISSKK